MTGFVNPPIGQTLALNTLECGLGALHIVNLKRSAVAVAKVKFRQVAMQMGLRAMLIDTLHPALEDAEIAFDCIG